jgi:hypothetical protein
VIHGCWCCAALFLLLQWLLAVPAGRTSCCHAACTADAQVLLLSALMVVLYAQVTTH